MKKLLPRTLVNFSRGGRKFKDTSYFIGAVSFLLLTFLVSGTSLDLNAQSTVASYPTLTANNGTSNVTFNLVNSQEINVTGFTCATTTGTHSVQVWYRSGGVNSTVNTSTGWVLHETVLVTSTSTTVPTQFSLVNPLNLPAGNYGICIGSGSSTRYMTYNASLASTFTDGTVTLNTGPGHGYGGTYPNLTFSTRCFVGSVTYELASRATDDAGVSSIDSPTVFCSGVQNIVATVKNYGINQINSVIVNWTYKSTLQTPVTVTTLIDTNNGTGPNEVQVTLGTQLFTSGVTDEIVAWTSMPNNVVDTSINNDTAMANVQPSLAGNFTVDPAGSGPNNYTSIGDAINDLNAYGVCGPVRFTVAPGTYNDQMDFGAIEGASSVNTITFVGDTTNSGGVILEYGATGATDNFVIRFNGCEYVTVNGFTFQNSTGGSTAYRAIFSMDQKASYNTLMNSTIKGYATTSTSQNLAPFWVNSGGNNYNKFMNNDIDANGHYYGVRFYGNSAEPNEYNEFIGNTIRDSRYYGVYIYYHTGTKFRNNTLNSVNTSTTGYGVYSYYGYDDVEFTGNKIEWAYYAMRIYQHSGSPSSNTLVANNWLVGGDGTYYVYGLYAGYCNFARIVHNTIWKNSSATYGYYACYIYQGTSNTVVNNLIYDPQGSSSYYGLYINPASAAGELDYNNVFTSANYGYLNGAKNDLAAWKAAGGGDHSYDYDPAFILTDSLRHCNDSLDNTGTPLPYVTTDIDGDLRSTETPDIGADEFVGSDSSSYSAGVDGELCNGQPIEIGAPITGGTYQWSTGSSDSMIMVSTPGTYSVIFTSACGGTFTDAVEVFDITPVASFDINYSFLSGDFQNTSNSYQSTYMWEVKTPNPDTIWNEDLVYVFEDNGPYEVCLTTFNKCDTVTTCQTWQGTVGIANTELDRHIQMYPNPSTNNVFIKFNEVEGDNLTIELINIQGQIVHTNVLSNIGSNGTETIDVSSLTKGVYTVRFVTDNDIATKQLVVQ